MWTDQQWELLNKFTQTDDTKYLHELAQTLQAEAETLKSRADALRIMAINRETAKRNKN